MSESSIPRRFFVSRLAVGTAALGVTAAAACTSSSSAAAPAPPMDTLETWLATMKGANKCIYDCVGAGGDSDGILFARNLLTLSGEKLGTKDTDMSVIVSFRHFATPFGYQTNVLVYQMGGYHYLDFVRVGIPLNLLTWVVGVLAIQFWFPF